MIGLLGAGALVFPAVAQPATLPANFSETLVAGGMTDPTAIAIAPDGRIFVTQQGGAVRVIESGALLPTAFATLTVDYPAGSERGLLGIALDPSFASNRFVYVYYTTPGPPIHNRVSRLVASVGNPNVSDGTVAPILDLDALTTQTNHNGGAIHFGPSDGKLYVAVGENANSLNAQDCTNRLGKMLRINSDGSIPSDNPATFTVPNCTPAGVNRAIWAMGLRNPYTFAFQPGTGRMFVNDVGQSSWEEINEGIAGSNYGWGAGQEGITGNPSYRDPLFAYDHSLPPVGSNPCAISGGAFYNPATATFPADYSGDYFFADFCGHWIHRYDVATDSASDFASNLSYPVDLAVEADGSLLYLQRGGGGQLYRVKYSAPTAVAAGSFRATRSSRGVLLRWRAGDPRVLGFNVYRGGRRVNPRLVTESGFLDRLAKRGPLRYRLQAVLGDGSRVWAAAATVT